MCMEGYIGCVCLLAVLPQCLPSGLHVRVLGRDLVCLWFWSFHVCQVGGI